MTKNIEIIYIIDRNIDFSVNLAIIALSIILFSFAGLLPLSDLLIQHNFIILLLFFTSLFYSCFLKLIKIYLFLKLNINNCFLSDYKLMIKKIRKSKLMSQKQKLELLNELNREINLKLSNQLIFNLKELDSYKNYTGY